LADATSGTLGVSKSGLGKWILSGGTTYSGPTAVSAGTLVLGQSQTKTSAANVTGGTLELASGGGSNRVLKTPAYTITGTGRIDIRDNKLITNVAAGSASAGVYNGVQGDVQRASNGGAWDQPGLTTSMPDAAGGLTSIGVGTGAQVRGLGPTDTDVFAGQTINGNSTIAMYTYARRREHGRRHHG
jgi:autotransporter-associated beta strand protein